MKKFYLYGDYRAAAAYIQQNGEDKGVLANLISKALSSKTTKVSIGAVDGALSSDATIRDIVLADDDGPWLKVDKARLVWRRLALIQGRLEKRKEQRKADLAKFN